MIEFRRINPLFKQIVLFSAVGVICYLVAIALLMLFVEAFAMEVNLANAISSLLTIFVCYLLNAKFVFERGRHSRSKEILSFYSVALMGFVLNVWLMYLFTTYVPIWYVISKTAVTLIVAVFNFILRKRLVFAN